MNKKIRNISTELKQKKRKLKKAKPEIKSEL